MSSGRRTTTKRSRKKAVRKPPVHWRKFLTQAELELPPPAADAAARSAACEDDEELDSGDYDPEWWQTRAFVFALAAVAAACAILAGVAMLGAARDRAAARTAEQREQVLTLRAVNSVRTLRIAPNPRSWSATPDMTIAWPEPPQLLELHVPVGYAQFLTFAINIDKVDHGRVLVIERMTPDSNKELVLALNSSAFGPGEYRMRLQGYTWRGERVDVGWVRLEVSAPVAATNR